MLLFQTAICSVVFVLQQQKRKHVKLAVDPNTYEAGKGLKPLAEGEQATVVALKPGDNRSDNTWLQYNHETCPTSAEQWNQPRFQHRSFMGFHSWPQ
jgi:proteasome activator subunit 4